MRLHKALVVCTALLLAGLVAAEPTTIAPPAAEVVRTPTQNSLKQHRWFAFGGSYFRLIGARDTGYMPKGVCVTPDSKHVYVTNFGNHDKSNIWRLDPDTLEVMARASFKGNAIECRTSRDSTLVWTTNFYHEEFLALDAITLEVARRYKVGKVPKHFSFSPDEKLAYVSNWESNSTTVLDLVTGEVRKHIKHGDTPRGTETTFDGKKVYVTNSAYRSGRKLGKSSITVIDTATMQVMKSIEGSCKAPRHAAITSDDRRVLVTCLGSARVIVIDRDTDQIIRSIPTATSPKTIELARDNRFAYISNYGSSALTIIDLTTWKTVLVPLPLQKASGVAVAPDDRRIYVTGWDSDSLLVLQRLLPGDQPGPRPNLPMRKLADRDKTQRRER